MFDVLRHESRQALRTVAARPAFSALVVLVLAAGLGCVLYVAAMIEGMVLRPLPFAQPDRLLHAGLIDNDDAADSDDYDALDGNEFLDWREVMQGTAEVAGVQAATINFSDNERPERYDGAYASANLMRVLGVAPALGRDFLPAEEAPGAAPVVLLSDALWRARYQSDPGVVGRKVRVNARDATIIGVMPPRFSFPWDQVVWLNATPARGEVNESDLVAVLRLAAGRTEAQVRALAEGWLVDATQRNPERMRSRARGIGVEPLAYLFVDRETRALFGIMLAAVLLVLLLACANVANLLLTQLASRQQELAMRVAMGASGRRLALALLAQTGLLALVALALALPLASALLHGTLALFAASAQDGPPGWMQFGIGMPVVALAVAATAATVLAAGVLPAMRAASSRDLALREGGRGTDGGFARASRWLVSGEIAASCALLIAAAVMVQAVRHMDRFDLGMRTDGVLTARVALFEGGYPDEAALREYAQRLLAELRADPAVVSASLGTSLPGLMGDNLDVLAQGAALPRDGLPNPGYSAVDPEFFSGMGLELVAGRFLAETDRADTDPVIVVDQTFVERIAGGGDVVGKRFVVDPLAPGARTATVVGVVRPVQMEDIDDAREPAFFAPWTQDPGRYFSIFVRTRGEPLAYAQRLREIAASLDGDTPMYWLRDYDQVLREATFGERVLARIFGAFGAVALLIAAAGLYGVVAFAVGQRTREIGVRRALGAPDGRVLRAVAGRSAIQVFAGLALGVALGIPFARLLAAQIPEAAQGAGAAGAAVVLLLAAVAAAAAWLPARRALRIEPLAALRHD